MRIAIIGLLALALTPLWLVAQNDHGETEAAVVKKPWFSPIASALVPGSGQLLAGHERGALYLAAEILFAAQYFASKAEGNRERDRFRDLAFNVARAPFAPTLRDTVFEYFEQMEKFIESGPFDTDPGPDIVPPTDSQSFNGDAWQLARETFFEDPANPPPPNSPDYQRALEFYQRRAIGQNFQWSWRNAGLEQDLFRQSITRSDDAFRSGTQYLGLLLANHLLSAIDAFVTQRLAASGPGSPSIRSQFWQRPGYRTRLGASVVVTLGF